MHKIVFMIIPAEKLSGNTTKNNIDSVIDTILAPYCGADDSKWQMDSYEVGGRWSGFWGVVKGTDCYPSEEGRFAYRQFQFYDALVNGGEIGPYIVEGTEYIPVIGAKKKNIAWECVPLFEMYSLFKLFQIAMNEDRDVLPEGLIIAGDKIYAPELPGNQVVYIEGESVYENIERRGADISRGMGLPDAFVDKDGCWHDDGEIWNNTRLIEEIAKEIDSSNEADLEEVVAGEFLKRFYSYLDDSVEDEDYIVVVDAHS